MTLTVSTSVYRQRVAQALLGRYRSHIARRVAPPVARNMAIAQTRLVDFPNLPARYLGTMLDDALALEAVRDQLRAWK